METYEDYLQHWGILGMKWGHRNGPPYPLSSQQMNASERKQNVAKGDDPRVKKLTTENKKLKTRNDNLKIQLADKRKAEKLAAKALKLEKKTLKEVDKQFKDSDSRKLIKKKARDLDDAELQTAINRFRQEQQFNSLKPTGVVTRGARFVKAVIASAGSKYITNLFDTVAKKASDNLADEIVNGKKKRAEAAEKARKEAQEKAERDRKAEEEREYNIAYQMAYNKARSIAGSFDSNGDHNNIDDIVKYNAQVESVINHILQSDGFDKWYKGK